MRRRRRRRRPLSVLSTPGNPRQTLQCCPNPPLPALTPHLQFSHLPSPPPHSPSKATLQRLRPQHHHVLSFWRTGTQSCGWRRLPCFKASTSLLLLPIRHMHQGTRPPSSALTTTNHLLNSHPLSLSRATAANSRTTPPCRTRRLTASTMHQARASRAQPAPSSTIPPERRLRRAAAGTCLHAPPCTCSS